MLNSTFFFIIIQKFKLNKNVQSIQHNTEICITYVYNNIYIIPSNKYNNNNKKNYIDRNTYRQWYRSTSLKLSNEINYFIF